MCINAYLVIVGEFLLRTKVVWLHGLEDQLRLQQFRLCPTSHKSHQGNQNSTAYDCSSSYTNSAQEHRTARGSRVHIASIQSSIRPHFACDSWRQARFLYSWHKTWKVVKGRGFSFPGTTLHEKKQLSDIHRPCGAAQPRRTGKLVARLGPVKQVKIEPFAKRA